MNKELYVIVLAFNHWVDTRECLDSLLKAPQDSMQIVLVDNGSTDETSVRVRADYPSVELLRLTTNLGFNLGYNAGIESALAAGAKYVAVMNNDTAAEASLFVELKSVLVSDAHIGMTVPKIVHYADPHRIWSAGARWRKFPPGSKLIGLGELDTPKYDQPKEIDLATGCCLLIKAEALRRIGLFDPSFLVYYSDWDFSRRMQKCGFKILYVPRARLKHKVSITAKKSNPGEFAKISGRDSVHFYFKHVNKWSLGLMTGWVMLRDIATGNAQLVFPYLSGVWQGLREERVHLDRLRA